MFESLVGFFFQLLYLFNHLTFSNVVDILLVATFFFVLFQALHRTRALQLLRGAIIIGVLGMALLVLLPFDTLNWLVRILLIAGALTLPSMFQDELRRALTGLGQIGRRRGYGTNFDRFKETVLIAVKRLAAQQQGALIVLEGYTPLDDIIETGIPLRADTLTPELLLTIFNPRTPLHDGAVVLRGDHLAAASCILPVQTESTGPLHLGTRHRAALGLATKVPDALVIVVSEETSRVSVVQEGHFSHGISFDQLDDALNRFRDKLAGQGSLRWQWLRGGGLYASLLNLVVAIVLAAIGWVSVVYATNPPQAITIAGVPLIVSGPDSGLVLMTSIPSAVSVNLQTTQDRAAETDISSVRADLTLSNLEAGVHQIPVEVTLADQRAQFLGASPPFVNIILEPDLTVTLTPTVQIQDLDSLLPGYAVGNVTLSPETLTVRGPQSQVEDVAQAIIDLTLEGSRTDFQKNLSPILVDLSGNVVEDLNPRPEQILVTVSMRRTFFTREIAIQPIVNIDTLESGYEVSRIQVAPASVTISGATAALDSAGDFLVTAPITLTGVMNQLTVNTPLILPEGVTAEDDVGDNIRSVSVVVDVKPITDYLVENVQVNLLNVADGLIARLQTNRVSVLLIGPQPLLDAMRDDPSLLLVYLDLTGIEEGAYKLPLQVDVPQGIEVQLFPAEVEVTLERPPEQ